MKKHGFAILFFTVFTCSLFAQNHLDILTSIQGAHHESCFGETMTTIDYNHDGYDDLVVCSPAWRNPYPSPVDIKGRVDVYFGGTNLDIVPDVSFLGTYEGQYDIVLNVGDVNGDGFEDLYIGGAESIANPPVHYIRIYTGGEGSPTEPGILIPYNFHVDDWSHCYVVRMGDINGDHLSEIGFILGVPINADAFYIVYGGSFEPILITIANIHSTSYTWGFNGIGDVNNDGYDDFSIGYTYDDPNVGYHLITLYYGNEGGLLTDTQVLIQTQAPISKQSNPIGDFNGDGIDDFVGYESNEGLNVWLGSSSLNTNPDLFLNPPWQGDYSGFSLKFGDINHDGYDDIVGTNIYTNQFRVWMGKWQVSGTSDLLVNAPYVPSNLLDYFGYALTMGDYNGDGCCDIAVSAPFTDNSMAHDYRGYVYVYAGNTDFVSNDDPYTPALGKLTLFPNPLHPQKAELNVRFTTPLDPPSGRGVRPSIFEIYNIRGQKVKSYILTVEQAKAGAASFNLYDLPTGVYICKVHDGNHFLQHKLTIIK